MYYFFPKQFTQYTKPSHSSAQGISLFFTLLVVSIALASALGLVNIFISSLSVSTSIHFSTIAFYAADSGLEGALFQDRNTANGLLDGFICNQSTPPDQDTCLSNLTNNAVYTYTVTGDTPNRKIVSQGSYQGIQRSVEIHY